MHIPFHLLSIVCSKKTLHRILIQQSFNDYKYIGTQFHKKYPMFEQVYNHEFQYYTTPDLPTPPPNMFSEMKQARTKQTRIIHEFVANVEAFCLAYPDEAICKNCFIRDYPEYPYRLEQNIESVVDLLHQKNHTKKLNE